MRNRAQIVDLSLNEYRALLRQDFSIFSQRCFRQLDPQTNFLNNWHIEVLAAKLEACRQGRIRRLIINIPPRHLKSHCASIAFPAWCLGHNPTAQILCVSYAQDLSDKLARGRGEPMPAPHQRTPVSIQSACDRPCDRRPRGHRGDLPHQRTA